MIKTIYGRYASGAALLLAAALTGCSDTTDAPADIDGAGRRAWMTVTVDRDADPSSRLTHTETAEGNLKACWDEGDKLYVRVGGAYGSGKQNSVLTLAAIDETDPSVATFTGYVALPAGTSYDKETATRASFYYLGKDATGAERALAADASGFTVSIAEQGGRFADMAANDIMYAADMAITVAPSGDGQYVATTESTIGMSHYFSFAHFAGNFPDGVQVTVSGPVTGNELTVTNLDMAYTATVEAGEIHVSTWTWNDARPQSGSRSAAAPRYDVEDGAGSEVTVVIPPAYRHFYVALNPTAAAGDLTFTYQKDNKNYSATLTSAKALPTGKYFTDNSNSDFGNAVELEFSEVQQPAPVPDDVVGPVFEINGSKYRFTSGNLYYEKVNGEWQWGIFKKQTESLGKAGKAYGTTDPLTMNGTPDKIDLFGWGATGLDDARKPYFWNENNWAKTESKSYMYPSTGNSTANNAITSFDTWTQYDWAVAIAQQNKVAVGTYRTVNSSEMSAIMSQHFVQGATVDNVCGCLLMPQADVASARKAIEDAGGTMKKNITKPNFNVNSTGGTGLFVYTNITLTYEQLTKINGVFFPAAGGTNANEEVYHGERGHYWYRNGSTQGNGYTLYFGGKSNPTAIHVDGGQYAKGKNFKSAVRLLKRVEE